MEAVWVSSFEPRFEMQDMLRLCGLIGLVWLVPFSLSAQSQRADHSPFQFEITKADSYGHPTFTVTNLSQKTLVAARFEFPWSSGASSQTAIEWDPIADGGTNDPRRGPFDLTPGESLTLPLPHLVDQPIPDRVDVVAGIWSDGETFGNTEWTRRLLAHRASAVEAYAQSISLLKEGLAQNWTRDQYLSALNSPPASGEQNALPFATIRSTLRIQPGLDQNPEARKRLIQNLLARFGHTLDLLHATGS